MLIFGPKFLEILDQNFARPVPKNCRRVGTLALEAIGLGVDSAMSLAGIWLVGFTSCCWLAMWLYGCGWLAGWGLYVAAYVWVAMLLAGFGARWLWLVCPPATLADSWLGCWLPIWLAIKLLAG